MDKNLDELIYKTAEFTGEVVAKLLLTIGLKVIPDAVNKALRRGDITPIINLPISHSNGSSIQVPVKMQIVDTPNGPQLKLFPCKLQLENALGFSNADLEKLRNGEVLCRDIRDDKGKKKKMLVQLDPDTNNLYTMPFSFMNQKINSINEILAKKELSEQAIREAVKKDPSKRDELINALPNGFNKDRVRVSGNEEDGYKIWIADKNGEWCSLSNHLESEMVNNIMQGSCSKESVACSLIGREIWELHRQESLIESIKDIQLGSNQKEALRKGLPVELQVGDEKVTMGVDLKSTDGFNVLKGDLDNYRKNREIAYDKAHPEVMGYVQTDENRWEFQQVRDLQAGNKEKVSAKVKESPRFKL